MSTRTLFLDRSLGEDRGVVLLDGRPERLLIAREGQPAAIQVGARLAARVRKVEPAFASAFLDLGDGHEALLAFKPDARPVEGSMLEVEIRSEPREGKLATARAVGASDGAPRLMAPAPSLVEQLAGYARDVPVVEGRAAREAADRAEDEALQTIHPLPGGGTIAIEPTRALVAIDVDLGERKGQDAKRITRQANLAALGVAARLLRLKGLGGIVVIDLVGRGHDGNALLTAARAAFAPDNPGVSIGPVGRFGTMELSIPRRGRSVREILLDAAGAPTDATLALRLIRQAETAAAQDPGARLVAAAAPSVVAVADPLAERLRARIGARFSLHPEPAWPRERIEVRPA
jgi:Ribonuclease G/E